MIRRVRVHARPWESRCRARTCGGRVIGSGLLAVCLHCVYSACFIGFTKPALTGLRLKPSSNQLLQRSAWDLFGTVRELLGQKDASDSEVPPNEWVPPVETGPPKPFLGGPDAREGFDSEDMQLEIVRYPHPALRRENALVEAFDGRLRQFVDNLFTSMYATGDGVGLAAPQVGVNLRVMVYNPNPEDANARAEWETVFVNPQIVARSQATDIADESCLSFPRMKGPVKRHTWVEVEAVDWEGRPFRQKITGFEACLFQHEYDHLDGIVYIDHLADPSRMRISPDLNFLIQDYERSGGTAPAL